VVELPFIQPLFGHTAFLTNHAYLRYYLSSHHTPPSEALNGVVTLDRLKKEHKKVAGRSELWNSLTNHLKSLLEAHPSSLDEISTCFTAALIHRIVDESERGRIERKVGTQ
jgi:hypothetical protein